MKLIIEYIKRYKITYIGIVIIFIVGLFIGVIVSFKTGNNEKMEIKDYIIESVENLIEEKSENIGGYRKPRRGFGSGGKH